MTTSEVRTERQPKRTAAAYAALWAQKHPEMTDRIARAVQAPDRDRPVRQNALN